jgi:hypothetical protein
MSKARPLPLPPSGISVWRPLSSSEGGLVAILGSGPSQGEQTSGEDVQCVWCGLRSLPAAACDVCGSPLYESIAIWQEAPSATVTPLALPGTTASDEPPARVPAPPLETRPVFVDEPMPTETEPIAESKPRESAFKAFRRFAGLDIRWVTSSGD